MTTTEQAMTPSEERLAVAAEIAVPRVAVVIPTHQRSSLLAAAVASVLEQTVRDLELVIVDDGSTDATPERVVALAAGDRRVRSLRQENRGLAAARNAGLELVTAPWVLFLDDDDLLCPGALAALLASTDGDVDAVVARVLRFDGADPGLGASEILAAGERHALAPWPPHPPSGPDLELGELLLRPLVPIHGVLFRAATLRRLRGFDTARTAAEDYDLCLRLVADGTARVRDEVVGLYRWHPDRMSAALGRQAGQTRLALEAFLAGHPRARRVAGRWRLRRRLAELCREEAYEALRRGQRRNTAAAALRGLGWSPLDPKLLLYLASAPVPYLYRVLRRFVNRASTRTCAV
jgi:glycosyltransferase involved in cell wall biosynthesis